MLVKQSEKKGKKAEQMHRTGADASEEREADASEEQEADGV